MHVSEEPGYMQIRYSPPSPSSFPATLVFLPPPILLALFRDRYLSFCLLFLRIVTPPRISRRHPCGGTCRARKGSLSLSPFATRHAHTHYRAHYVFLRTIYSRRSFVLRESILRVASTLKPLSTRLLLLLLFCAPFNVTLEDSLKRRLRF